MAHSVYLCIFLTKVGISFRDYVYTGSTEGWELYIFIIPFMDSISFSFLLFASDCAALVFVLPHGKMAEQPGGLFDAKLRTSCAVVGPRLR